jgi:hypothetical protein
METSGQYVETDIEMPSWHVRRGGRLPNGHSGQSLTMRPVIAITDSGLTGQARLRIEFNAYVA